MCASSAQSSTQQRRDRRLWSRRPHQLSRRAVLGGAATAAVGISAAAGLTPFLRSSPPAVWDGATQWLNSQPLTVAALKGKVVVVDFWTYTCINWIRTAPFLRGWWDAYRNDGLVIVGVHTPEFSFEHDLARVRRSARDRGIRFPIAVDNDYAIWRAFDNSYWPALYFLDRAGTIRHSHFGELDYEENERILQDLLGVDRDPVAVQARGVEATADWTTLLTPETYLGYGRGDGPASDSGTANDVSSQYSSPQGLSPNAWGLAGEWTVEREKAVISSAGGSVSLRFHARDVHLVMSRHTPRPVPFQVLLDGRSPGPHHGVDVDPEGNGLIEDGRLYQLIRAQSAVRSRIVEVTFTEPGAEAYSFTFG